MFKLFFNCLVWIWFWQCIGSNRSLRMLCERCVQFLPDVMVCIPSQLDAYVMLPSMHRSSYLSSDDLSRYVTHCFQSSLEAGWSWFKWFEYRLFFALESARGFGFEIGCLNFFWKADWMWQYCLSSILCMADNGFWHWSLAIEKFVIAFERYGLVANFCLI